MMLQLEEIQALFQQEARKFLDQLLDRQGPALFKDTLFLSFLGARVCYASTRPLSLFAEKRFQDQAELLAFLLRLKASGHTSIFAHSPLVAQVPSGSDPGVLARVLYKAWWSPEGNKVCLNLRHVAEVYEDQSFKEILAASLQESNSWLGFRTFVLLIEGSEPKLVEKTPLADQIAQAEEEYTGLWAHPRVTVIDVAPEETAPFGWLAVIVEGMSRLFSHQYVRHTWLNFNQRSHRYTQIDQFVCPPSFGEEARKLYEEEIKRGLEAYQTLIKLGIKKEDARFVTPQGSATTILATGPYFVWQDFVRKRRHLKAQWEIRALARALELVFQELDL